MKKKGKGKTPQQLKLEQAHQKNLYFQKLKSVMDTIADEPVFYLLSPRETETIYLTRIRPLKLKFAKIDGHAAPGDFEKSVNDFLSKILKQTQVTIDNSGRQVSLYEFYTFVETIFLCWRNTTDDWFPGAHKFVERLSVFKNGYKAKRVELLEQVDQKVKQLAWMFSHIPDFITWISRENKQLNSGATGNSEFFNNYLVNMVPPESEVLDIVGNKRSIFRVGFGMEDGIKWLSVTPEKLGRHGVLDKFPLKVYIQKHAVERIKERLGDFFHKINFFLITTAIIECDVHPAEGNSLLFLCKYNSIKLGYLKASILGDKVLIRTFLFLTNNGTPEGKKLESLLGIQKEDKKYLGIDKLNLFINSDIEQNEYLKEIFCKAGCSHLFEIRKYLFQDQDPIIRCADSFSKYLGLENQQICSTKQPCGEIRE